MNSISPSVGIAATVTLVALWAILRRITARPLLDNLPGPSNRHSWLLGDFPPLLEMKCEQAWQAHSETYGPVSRLRGLFGTRVLHVFDPKALHTILNKDVDIYPKHVAPFGEMEMLLGPSIQTTAGSQHRRQRKMLNPMFSTDHLRDMTEIFYDIARHIHKVIEARVGKELTQVDVHGWMARTSLEMVGQAGLGYSFDDFSKDSTDAYGGSLKSFFPALAQLSAFALIVPWLSYIFSKRALRKALRLVPLVNVHRLLDITDVMEQRSKEIIREKILALEQGDAELMHRVGEGKDIMSILLKANSAAEESERLTHEEIVAQMSTLILAGKDTTSTTLSRIFALLAEHPDVQEKLRAEILEAQGGQHKGAKIDYDDLVKLPYLDAVCRETLRLHAPLMLIARGAATDSVLPLSEPIRARDGSMITEVVVPKGTLILVNLRASNRHKALWGEEALEWRPERWFESAPIELEEARVPGVYSNVMSFSGGTRSCIGFKFALLELKIMLAVLLASFKFELTGEPIGWNFVVQYPTMGEDNAPQMLLNVKAL